jgi:transglutaminase-like putative cysteine protease
VTEFAYSQPVSISHHLLHLTPRVCDHQINHRSSLVIDPAPAVHEASLDYFGNPTAFIIVQKPHEKLTIQARSVIDVETVPAPQPLETMAWDEVGTSVKSDSSKPMLDVAQFMFGSPFTKAGDDVEAYARESFPPGRPVLDAARELTGRIFQDFTYDGSATDVSTPVDEAMRLKRGVCQDFAHLQLACLRKLDLPARYVSGYLLTHPPEGQEKLTGADASHAWLSIWVPDHGWVDLDPTNDLIPGDEHITLAWGRDYGDVSPVNGVMVGGGAHEVNVAVDVRPTDDA